MDHAHMMSKLVRRGKPEMQPAPMAKVLAGSFHLGRTASHRSRSSRSSSINLSASAVFGYWPTDQRRR